MVIEPANGRVPVRPAAEKTRDENLKRSFEDPEYERVGSLHHARRSRLDVPGRLQQRVSDSADAGA